MGGQVLNRMDAIGCGLLATVIVTACGGDDGPFCGDGSLNSTSGETCDDGNAIAGDGCSASCEVESGWDCTSTARDASTCSMMFGYACGDGHRLTSERCDDGNSSAGDGCSASCEVEDGWFCRTERMWDGEKHVALSTCMPTLAYGESCREDVECSGECSYQDTSEMNATICITGQGEPCTADTCPEHMWSDYLRTVYAGGCLETLDGQGMCLTGCAYGTDCPDGWVCWRQSNIAGEDGQCMQPCESPDECVGTMQSCEAEGMWAGYCVGTA